MYVTPQGPKQMLVKACSLTPFLLPAAENKTVLQSKAPAAQNTIPIGVVKLVALQNTPIQSLPPLIKMLDPRTRKFNF